jgi:hypothetical protein
MVARSKNSYIFFYLLAKKLGMEIKEICHGLPRNGFMDGLKVRFC